MHGFMSTHSLRKRKDKQDKESNVKQVLIKDSSYPRSNSARLLCHIKKDPASHTFDHELVLFACLHSEVLVLK